MGEVQVIRKKRVPMKEYISVPLCYSEKCATTKHSFSGQYKNTESSHCPDCGGILIKKLGHFLPNGRFMTKREHPSKNRSI